MTNLYSINSKIIIKIYPIFLIKIGEENSFPFKSDRCGRKYQVSCLNRHYLRFNTNGKELQPTLVVVHVIIVFHAVIASRC